MQQLFRVRAAVAVISLASLVVLSGCLFDSAPEQPNSNATIPGGDNNPPPPPGDVGLGLGVDLTPHGPTLYTLPDNYWNLRVDSAPLDPNSASIIATIKTYESTGGRCHPDFGPNYGIPYCVVDGSTPKVAVSFNYASESDKGPYPIPVAAKTNSRYFENAGTFSNGNGGDMHILMLDRDSWILYELSYANWNGSSWSAGAGAIFDLKTNGRRPDGWTSTSAGGLAVLAGLVRPDEAFGPDPIKHALRFSIKRTNGYVWPASHSGASDAGAPPLGMRVRLKASVDISGYPAPVRKIFQAMKTYGGILDDRGGNFYWQGVMDARWDNNELNPAFHSLHADDFEVIKLGWKP